MGGLRQAISGTVVRLGGSGGVGTGGGPSQIGIHPQHASNAAFLRPLCKTRNKVGFTIACR